MTAEEEDVLLVCVGNKKGPNKFKYWTWWHNASTEDFKRKQKFLERVRWQGFGYGYGYYYNGNKIWFRKSEDMLLYMLSFG